MGGKQSKEKPKGTKSEQKGPAEPPKHRLAAYEEYQQRYGSTQAAQSSHREQKPEKTKDRHPAKHRSSAPPDSPKGGQMDADEFGRLKQAQQREKLRKMV